MILILEGIKFLINEIITLATESTKKTDKDITTAGSNLTVIASAEHMPKTWTVIGLLSSSGSVNSYLFFFENNDSLLIIN